MKIEYKSNAYKNMLIILFSLPFISLISGGINIILLGYLLLYLISIYYVLTKSGWIFWILNIHMLIQLTVAFRLLKSNNLNEIFKSFDDSFAICIAILFAIVAFTANKYIYKKE